MLVPTATCVDQYDLLIVVLGYEPRSTLIAERFASTSTIKWALSYDTPGKFAYDENEIVLSDEGFRFFEAGTADLPELIGRFLPTSSDDRAVRICLDISSMTRQLLAETVIALNQVSDETLLHCDFFYFPAKFRR